MQPGGPARKFGWEEDEVEISHLTSATDGISARVVSSANLGPQLVKGRSPPQLLAGPSKIHPEPEVTRRTSIEKRDAHRSSVWGSLTDFSMRLLRAQTRATYLQWILAVVVFSCLLWTIWLIFLNISPNYTVNLVMNTVHFDDGAFWLFVDPPSGTLHLAVTGLSLVSLGYVVILLMLACRPKQAARSSPSKQILKAGMEKLESSASNSRTTSSALKLINSFTKADSSSRRFVKLWMKIGDLAFETILLVQILEAGSPAVIVGIFTVVIASNALVFAVMMLLPLNRMGLAETLANLLFDLLIAVGCPMMILCYCLANFNFPRGKFAINLDVFPAGWFETQASVVADPVQTAVIYKSLKSLRITTVYELFARMGIHVTLFMRLRELVILIQKPKMQLIRVYPSCHRPAAFFFVVFAGLLCFFVEESMRTSNLACAPHPECAVNARRWTLMENREVIHCPCLIMIDQDIAPKTYAEWVMPKNLTDKVAQLASTGDLQTLQLTNRYLPILPDELRLCTGLRHLTLEYTHTQMLPDWIKEFTNLEYFHLESKFTSPVVSLPDDIFDNMSSLTFIHFAVFIPMKRLPSFKGLTNLKSLTLAVFLSLEEIPALDSLRRLEKLLVTCSPSLDTLPDLAPVRNLKSLVLTDRGTWCCNGFLGECNLDNPMCQIHPLWGTPAATCLTSSDPRATPETLALIAKYPENVCTGLLRPGSLEGPPTEATMDPCNGTLYRQCVDPSGAESMCYNARFMGIACDTNPFPIKMRRLQIARGVGDKCDPEYEAWLGCK
ncbi:uncharacterized protein IUM83_18678 [Phytophthora cinnamomi]|uniref:uncharacterized protein n=1 Tax=Phytophthora cinnamomi TaxID=4785 RepID=UPI00355A728C|nr:hypothetical protein IUM83_18678 [Phytophthora cinnamomi]